MPENPKLIVPPFNKDDIKDIAVEAVQQAYEDGTLVDKGTYVVANPELAGTEADLESIQIANTKYKIGGGSGNAPVVHDAPAKINQLATYTEFLNGLNPGDIVVYHGTDDGEYWEIYSVNNKNEIGLTLVNVYGKYVYNVAYSYDSESGTWSYSDYGSQTYSITTVEANSGTAGSIPLTRLKIGDSTYPILGFQKKVSTNYASSTGELSINSADLPGEDTTILLVDMLDSSKVYGFAYCKYNTNNMSCDLWGCALGGFIQQNISIDYNMHALSLKSFS